MAATLIIPCPNRVNCPGSDNPFANLTAEAPDSQIFVGSNFGSAQLLPPLGWSWRNPRGFGFCGSNLSQQDADLCAGRTGVIDKADDPPGGDGGHWTDPTGKPATIHTNTAQICSSFCPDGLPFTYQVAGGLFDNIVQADADAAAKSYACTLARVNEICFGSFTTSCCLGQPYDSVMDIQGRGPFTISVIGGMLPPGLSLNAVSTQTSANGLELQGIPVTSGTYPFTLRAINPAGNSQQKTFTLVVWGFTSPNTLPPFAANQPYSYQFVGEGGTPPYTFTPASDADMAVLTTNHLTLTAAGLLSGTPTVTTPIVFNVSITDSSP